MWTWLLVPPSQLPISLVASTSVASVSGCQYLSCQLLWLPVSVASVSGCQYLSCQLLWLPVSVASFSGCQYLNCQCLGCRELQLPVPLPQLLVPLHQLPVSRLLVPKLPVPLPRLSESAGALAGIHVPCHGCRGYHQASC